jgi:hypothetical protein
MSVPSLALVLLGAMSIGGLPASLVLVMLLYQE